MSLKKRILSAIAAMTMIVSSFAAVATTVSADADPTVKVSLMDSDYISTNCPPTSVAGVIITFENFDTSKKIGNFDFDIQVPKDLMVYGKTGGTAWAPTYGAVELNVNTFASAFMMSPAQPTNIFDKSEEATSTDYYNFRVQCTNVQTDITAEYPLFFCSTDASYSLEGKTDAFKVGRVSVVYGDGVSPVEGVVVSNPTIAGGDVAVTGVTLNQSEVNLDLNGITEATLVATVTPADATDPTVTWTSSVPGVATVDGGVVTAVATGTTVITAKAGDFEDTCTVTVVDTTPATEGNGEITTEQSGDAKDAAVWAWKELTGNGKEVNVTIDANGTVLTKKFTLGASVETAGAAKVGIVIQYDPAKIGGKVSITDISLATAN